MRVSKNSLPYEFSDDECFLRAVWPPSKFPHFWTGSRVSSAAFKKKEGLSVNRTGNRTVAQAIPPTCIKFPGSSIVSITVALCKKHKIIMRYMPSEDDIYHSELHGSQRDIVLSDIQAHQLAKNATVVFKINS